MAWFRTGGESRRAKPKRVHRFEAADRVVVNAFAYLQRAHYLKCNQHPEIFPRAVERFEREAWDRLIDYLVRLPPLPSDY